jgi:hypothetical protein
MPRLTQKILEYAATLPEGTPIAARSLLHLGNRAAVDQALSRLARREQLIRVGRGLYVFSVMGRYGPRAPFIEQVVEALSVQRGEVIVSNTAAAANALGLTTQVPVRLIYLTSGRSRKFDLEGQVAELRHAPRWQLTLASHPAGRVIRALAYIGPEKAVATLRSLKKKLPPEVFSELVAAAPQLPTWLVQSIGEVAGR